MLSDWLRALGDDDLLIWSSRGLVRRASKLLAGLEPSAIVLDADAARATIDGHEQSTDGVGFERATCSCPATGRCHHVVCFFLGLRALAGGSEEAPSSPPFWLAAGDDALAGELGRPHLRTARRWLAEAVPVAWEESAQGLRATVELERPVTVRLPAVGGFAASVCGCKAPACAHRALAVLAVRRHHGIGDGAAYELTLDERQQDTVELARRWLLDLVAQGLVGLSPIQIDRGAALATELRQADLPRPARLLARSVAGCRDIVAGATAQAPDRLLQGVAECWAVLSGLEVTPPPRPLPELAGSHRTRYRVAPALRLLTLGPELWRTDTGFRGYSMHFVEPGARRFMAWSETRGAGQDPGWRPDVALGAGAFANRSLADLAAASFTVEGAAVNADGRLSARDDTRVIDLAPAGAGHVVRLAGTVDGARAGLAGALEAHPIALPEPRPALLGCTLDEAPRLDPYRGQWCVETCDPGGEPFAVEVDDEAAARLLARRRGAIRALFGRARLDGPAIRLRPVIAYTASEVIALTRARSDD